MELMPLSVLRALGAVLLGAGGATAVVAFTRLRWAPWTERVRAYEAAVGRELLFLRLGLNARQWLWGQLVGVAMVVACLVLRLWIPAGLLLLLVAMAWPFLQIKRAQRVTQLDEQLDGWLSGLAGSLRATPSLGEALGHSATLVAPPLRDELEQTLKEHRLGVALDEALARMGERVGSRTLLSVMGAIRIGRNTGGQLSEILERSAATLREMARLEGVVRTRTAEGRAQAVVMGVLPAPLIGLIHYLNPELLVPLTADFRGYLVSATACALFMGAAVFAWRILDVDI